MDRYEREISYTEKTKISYMMGRQGLDNEQNIVNSQPVYTLWSSFYEKVHWVLSGRIHISPSSNKILEEGQINHVRKKLLLKCPS